MKITHSLDRDTGDYIIKADGRKISSAVKRPVNTKREWFVDDVYGPFRTMRNLKTWWNGRVTPASRTFDFRDYCVAKTS